MGFKDYLQGKAVTQEQRWIYYGWASSTIPETVSDDAIVYGLDFDIADNAVEIAEAAGLEKEDRSGNRPLLL